jgi:molybdate transport system substrate-binding protein
VQYAASGTLARQIEAGAPADVFICADAGWMDYLGQRDLLSRGSRIDLLGNRLVLITPADSPLTLSVGPGFPLAAALGDGHLALGDPESVPAGRYARAALESLGVWPQISDRVVRADSVRTALAFVERGDAPLGIVYYTDARDDPRVRIAGTFPTGTHPPVIYPLALLRDHQAGSEAMSAFLQGPTARAVFERHGFTVLR